MNKFKQTTQFKKNKSFGEKNMINILKIKSTDKNRKYIKELLLRKDFEINSLKYEEALKFDKRNYFQYYISLLKYNNPLIFSFCICNDYNCQIIKIFFFFFSFSSDLTINALFFKR